jgi:cytochrome c oxidase subunit 2
MKLTSADVMHSFWVPRLAGKTDVLPNRVNEMWVDAHRPGLYLGQCAQFCGQEQAKMLLRVYVDTPEEFQRWVANQKAPQESGTAPIVEQQVEQIPENAASTASPSPAAYSTMGKLPQASPNASDAVNAQQGRRVFETQACINCHTISGTVANGRYGPDLTHLMSRATIAAGLIPNTAANLKAWVADPNTFKPGTLMPAMHLTERENDQLVAYLTTLR